MSLLKKYIKSVLKEVINHDDSLEIEEIIKQVNLVFEAESLSLYSLNFDPKIIAVFNNFYHPPSSSFSFCEIDLGSFLFITFQIPLPEAII